MVWGFDRFLLNFLLHLGIFVVPWIDKDPVEWEVVFILSMFRWKHN